MYTRCTHCGNQVSLGQKFCPECGSSSDGGLFSKRPADDGFTSDLQRDMAQGDAKSCLLHIQVYGGSLAVLLALGWFFFVALPNFINFFAHNLLLAIVLVLLFILVISFIIVALMRLMRRLRKRRRLLPEMTVAWLETKTFPEEYRFLKEHRELLHPNITLDLEKDVEAMAQILQRKSGSTSEEMMKIQYIYPRMYYGLEMLHEIGKRGRTVEAIRTVYIDRHSGLVDVPPWLEVMSQQLGTQPPSVTKISLLLEALARAQGEDSISPETSAELDGRLADAIVATYANKALTQKAVELYTMALRVYTFAHYPRQHARIQRNLGVAYEISNEGDELENLEQAITCHQAALQFYTRDAFPDEWTDTQDRLRSVSSRLRKLKEQSGDYP